MAGLYTEPSRTGPLGRSLCFSSLQVWAGFSPFSLCEHLCSPTLPLMLQMKQTLHRFLTPFCLIHQTSVLGHSMGRFPEDFPMFSCSNCKSGTVSSALFPKRTALGVCIFPLGLLEEPRPGVLVLGPMHGSGPGSNSAGEHTSHKRVRDRRRLGQVSCRQPVPRGVPHSSGLGPVLGKIFINNFIWLQELNATVTLY